MESPIQDTDQDNGDEPTLGNPMRKRRGRPPGVKNRPAQVVSERQSAASAGKSDEQDVARRLAQAQKSVSVKPVAKKEVERTDGFWVMKCTRHHHIGAFFGGGLRPHGARSASEWWSADKPLDSPWPLRTVPCQVCGRDLKFFHTPDGRLVPNQRFVEFLTHAEIELLMSGASVVELMEMRETKSREAQAEQGVAS